MADVFRDVTSQSFGGRIGQSFGGVIIGFILFVAAFPLLFWNEGRAIRDAKALEEGSKSVISVEADKVDPANQGKLIHITGDGKTDAVLADAPFGVSLNAIALARDVQMYQWKEKSESKTHDKLGGGSETETVYTYTKAWDSSHIKSDNFKKPTADDGTPHVNPTDWKYDSTRQFAKNVTVGAFKLTSEQIEMVEPKEALPATEPPVPTSPATNTAELPEVFGSAYYIGDDHNNPRVGDLKITFRVARPEPLSIIAQQSGSSFVPFMTKVGKPIDMLTVGQHSADEMFTQAKQAAAMLTWILRLVGFVIMAIGIGLTLNPLKVLAGVIPLLGDLTGMATGLVAFLGAFVLSLITIAIAWVFYRPLVGILLLAAAAAGGFLLMRSRRPAQRLAGGAAVPAPGGPPPLR